MTTMYNANFATPDARESKGPRYSMPAIGARAALDNMSKHFAAKAAGTEDFIPSSPEGEYIIPVTLATHRFAPRGEMGMWESGGSMGNYGASNVFASPDAQPLNPLFQHHVDPENACNKHILVPAKEGYLMAHAAHGNGTVLITAWRMQTLDFRKDEANSDRGGVWVAQYKLIYASEGIDKEPIFLAEEEEATPDNPMFQAFLKAAWTKANMARCMTHVWAYPWSAWSVRPGGKEWEMPEIVSAQDAIIEAIAGVGMSDPDPKMVCEDYNLMIAEIEAIASNTIKKFRNASQAARGPRVHVLQYFTQEENSPKVRITTFVLMHNVKTPKIVATKIYFADPNTTPESERREPAYYLNNRRFIRWDLIKGKFANETVNGECRLVYEYTGC